jgi:hypothetical protein
MSDDRAKVCTMADMHGVRRYLRARKFSPEEALKQFKDTEDWRKANRLDELYDTIDIGEYEQSRRLVCYPIEVSNNMNGTDNLLVSPMDRPKGQARYTREQNQYPHEAPLLTTSSGICLRGSTTQLESDQ